MWCDACRSVGTIHCAHPDQCGNMRSNNAAAENWNAWLDDLPIGAEFHPAIDRLQDFIAGLAEAAEAERDQAWKMVAEADTRLGQALGDAIQDKADNARLRAIGIEMAESIEGNYYLPGVATRWRAALNTGKEPSHE